MKMLVVSPFLPYPVDSGGKTRLFNLVKEGSKYFSVHFLFVNHGQQKIDLGDCRLALPGVVFHQVVADNSKFKQLFYLFLRIFGCQFFAIEKLKEP